MPAVKQGVPNRGSVALSKKCPDFGDQQKLAEKHGFDPGQVSRWCRGLRKPETSARVAMFEDPELAIGLSWWDDESANGHESPPPVEPPNGDTAAQ